MLALLDSEKALRAELAEERERRAETVAACAELREEVERLRAGRKQGQAEMSEALGRAVMSDADCEVWPDWVYRVREGRQMLREIKDRHQERQDDEGYAFCIGCGKPTADAPCPDFLAAKRGLGECSRCGGSGEIGRACGCGGRAGDAV